MAADSTEARGRLAPETEVVLETRRSARAGQESVLGEVTSTRGWTGKVAPLLAARWHEFVDCAKRLNTEGPFLQRLLQKYKEPVVLDAAAGIGCESVWLTDMGYKVISNEICPALRALAHERARQYGVSLDIRTVDWRDLVGGFGTGCFDVVLLLGNSLCLLRSEDERMAAASGLRRICKDEGTVVVDERNFDYLLSNSDEVVHGKFRYSGEVMYCGTAVVGLPVSVSADDVTFAYLDAEAMDVIGTLDMHPFRKGELRSLLRDAGFSRIETYSDLRDGIREDADFYTHVCGP